MQKWVHGDYFGNKGGRRGIDLVTHQLPISLEKVETLTSIGGGGSGRPINNVILLVLRDIYRCFKELRSYIIKHLHAND